MAWNASPNFNDGWVDVTQQWAVSRQQLAAQNNAANMFAQAQAQASAQSHQVVLSPLTFQGPCYGLPKVGPSADDEFEWLRRQVAAVLWYPEKKALTAPVKPPSVVLQPKSAPYPSTKFGTITPVVPPSAMSVSEYNAWRGSGDAKAQKLPYVRQEYPAWLYREGYAPKFVEDAITHQRLLKEGWKDTP